MFLIFICFEMLGVLYLQVKLVKCIVQNIVVDISFNQLGGLCTLCFLEKVVASEDHQPLLKYWDMYTFLRFDSFHSTF